MLLCQHTVLTIKTDQQLLVLQHSPVQTSCKNQLLGLDSAHPRKKEDRISIIKMCVSKKANMST